MKLKYFFILIISILHSYSLNAVNMTTLEKSGKVYWYTEVKQYSIINDQSKFEKNCSVDTLFLHFQESEDGIITVSIYEGSFNSMIPLRNLGNEVLDGKLGTFKIQDTGYENKNVVLMVHNDNTTRKIIIDNGEIKIFNLNKTKYYHFSAHELVIALNYEHMRGMINDIYNYQELKNAPTSSILIDGEKNLSPKFDVRKGEKKTVRFELTSLSEKQIELGASISSPTKYTATFYPSNLIKPKGKVFLDITINGDKFPSVGKSMSTIIITEDGKRSGYTSAKIKVMTEIFE